MPHQRKYSAWSKLPPYYHFDPVNMLEHRVSITFENLRLKTTLLPITEPDKSSLPFYTILTELTHKVLS